MSDKPKIFQSLVPAGTVVLVNNEKEQSKLPKSFQHKQNNTYGWLARNKQVAQTKQKKNTCNCHSCTVAITVAIEPHNHIVFYCKSRLLSSYLVFINSIPADADADTPLSIFSRL